MRIAAAKPLAEILETEWDGMLFRAKDCLAASTGWVSYHTLRSRGSKSGFPDRTLYRERIIFVELKREKAKPTEEQIRWLDGLARAGGEVYLWRPSDLDEIGHILSGRPRFVPCGPSVNPHLVRADLTHWYPRSAWIPGMGRADDAGVE